MLSHSSHHPQQVLLAQFSLCVHKVGLKQHSFMRVKWKWFEEFVIFYFQIKVYMGLCGVASMFATKHCFIQAVALAEEEDVHGVS